MSVPHPSLHPMSESDGNVDQLLCEHRWERPVDGGEHPRCGSCGLSNADYVHGTVRAALSRMDAWP